MQEAEEILEMLKSTWRVLGITQTIHDTCYTWVLFRQVRSRYQYLSITVVEVFRFEIHDDYTDIKQEAGYRAWAIHFPTFLSLSFTCLQPASTPSF